MIKTNTHHAYLNTDIILTSDEACVVTDTLTSKEYCIENESVVLKLCAGKHIFKSNDSAREVIVEIEDAIKLGGSTIKQAFVFDDNPWVFVTTKDRLYVSNIKTKEEKVEFNVTPNEIRSLGVYFGKPSDFFLLKTHDDYSIFNVSTGRHVINFSNHIYSNSHLVVYKNDNTVVVYDYRKETLIVEFDSQYSFGNKLYFVKDEMLHGLNLSTNYINIISSIGKLDTNYLLSENYLLRLNSNTRIGGKKYILYSLGNGETNITKTDLILPYFIESFLGKQTIEYDGLENEYKKIVQENKSLISTYHNLCICCKGIQIDRVESIWENKTHMLQMAGHIKSYPSEPFDIPFIIKGEYEGTINFKDILIESNQIENHDKQESKTQELQLDNNTNLLGISESGNLYITRQDDEVVLNNRITNEHVNLLKNVFDTSSYNSAYFTSDGKNVVFVGRDKSMGILGFEDMTQMPFAVEGACVARNAGFNGYKPEISFLETNGRKPVWRDPISLKKISENDMSNHSFMSPDGKFIAEMQKKTVYYNRLSKQEITQKEYIALCNKYNWTRQVSEEEKKQKITLREQLLDNYGKTDLFTHLHENNEKLIRGTQSGKISEEKIKKRIESLNSSSEEEYIKSKNEFTPLFIDILGYVSYKDIDNNKEKRILIGRSVWFLNYVSFSYDSRYLAFGAKMKDDTWRFSEEGVFEIYDLKEDKIVDRKATDSDLHAVWMTMFSKNGDVAYYDSHANAMVAYAESDYKYTNVAIGKSLLCFSPSGRYIALSDQNYVSYLHHPSSEWGHQPSGNIFIYETTDLKNCIEHHNDLGDGIDGTTKTSRRAGNVASAAFSSDESRLLAVGEDGVIVIRNLIIPELEQMEYDGFILTGGSQEKHYYRKDERNGIVQMTCRSYDGVTNNVVDFWCNPDETLDASTGLIFSQDKTVLKNSLNIYNTVCHVPEGVIKIEYDTFHGMYAPGEGDDCALTDLYLPDSIEIIEETFEQCSALRNIFVSKVIKDKVDEMLPDFVNIIKTL